MVEEKNLELTELENAVVGFSVDAFSNFIDLFIEQVEVKDSVYLSKAILEEALYNAFEDKFAYFGESLDIDENDAEDFANMMNESLTFAACDIYWILKRKPIQIKEGAEVDREDLYINEIFCLEYLGMILFSSEEIEKITNNEEMAQAFHDYFDELRYKLFYTDVTKNELQMILSSFAFFRSLTGDTEEE